MGCFSFLCNKCDKPINSNSSSGEHATLFLLERGEIIEKMSGQYDSYGRVFDETKVSVPWASYPWRDVCKLMFSKDTTNGIAAYHTRCLTEGTTPYCRSKDDPEQGWGEYDVTNEVQHSHTIFKSNKTNSENH